MRKFQVGDYVKVMLGSGRTGMVVGFSRPGGLVKVSFGNLKRIEIYHPDALMRITV